MSHTFLPERDRQAQTLAATAILIAAFTAVVVFFPAEGHVLVPLHSVVVELLGHAAFLLPLGLALVGCLALLRRAFPHYNLPPRRLAGVGLLVIALLAGEPLFGSSTGLLGDWLSGFLTDLLGAPTTIALTLLLVAVGAVFVFDLKLRKGRRVAAS